MYSWDPLAHVLRPGLELTAHDRLGGALVRIGRTAFPRIATVIPVEAHPLAPFRLQAPLSLRPVLEVVGIDHGGGRIDEVEVPERAAVNRLGDALQSEMPDLRQRFVGSQRAQHP